MKTLQIIRLIIVLCIISGYFSLAAVDFISGNRGWKVPLLAILYGSANVVIFLFRGGV